MGRTYQAMLRAERERSGQGQTVLHSPAVEVLHSEDEHETRTLLSGEVDWGSFVFDQVGSIDQKLDAFDEALHKRVPEFEGRMLQLLELRLGSLERSLFSRIGGMSRELLGAGGLRQRLLLGILGLLGLNLLLLGAVLAKLS